MPRIKWWKGPLALAIGTAFAVPAFAQGTSSQASSGVSASNLYVGADVGLNTDDETGFGIFAGYDFTRNFAAELGYSDTGQSNIGNVGVDTNAWEITGVGRLPVTDRIDAFGKLGFYRGHVEGGGDSDSHNDLTFGFGAQYNVNPQLGLRVSWQRYADMGSDFRGSSGEDLDMWKLGVVYRFR